MELNLNLLPVHDRKILSASSTSKQISPDLGEENFTEKICEKKTSTDKHKKGNQEKKMSTPDLRNLSQKDQELILQAFETIKIEDSINVVETLNESRSLLRISLEEFQREQDEFKKQLEETAHYKALATTRKKENAIPISVFLRQKRDIEGLADLRPNSGMNATYQAYFEALLTPDNNQERHESDRTAVIKYIRRRERRRRAENNRKVNALSGDALEKQTAKLIEKMDGVDAKLESERQRQNDLMRMKMNEKQLEAQSRIEVAEILDQAHEADLARGRVEQKHRDKLEACLISAREQFNRTPTNMIHVQSLVNDDDDDKNFKLSDEQKEQTKKSIQLLNVNNDIGKVICPQTHVYGGIQDSNEKITNIDI